MAQESVVETDNGIIITNNVELSTVRNSSGNSEDKSTVDEVQTLQPTGSNSIRRHNISISSIDSNTSSASSSTASESETDDDAKPNCTDIQNLTTQYLSNGDVPTQDGVLPIFDNTPAHNISSIAIKNSTNVRFGNTQEFHAPVTIQQFMMDEERKKWTEVANGIVNDGFVKSFNDTTSSNSNNNNNHDSGNIYNSIYYRKPPYLFIYKFNTQTMPTCPKMSYRKYRKNYKIITLLAQYVVV